ncbi:tRNA lysidine(34) synthetase TilS [Desulforhopalus vacuolatus]|uniref:tRNA lysidine(34) synthetase TilS n=1 Tax=Desulforhopalus vacuolatus TaxID=40414 RepID=UPI001965B14C|nr:tRNA lysidine(34) synthetase TilS [Desulforhopalus vacuolatus]MBM9519629.1 tRNA lysidine(34) synthetase TilS [Desulforhopalus vacuolatus]
MKQPARTTLIDRVRATVHKEALIQSGERILVGISGGSDSVALLHLLTALVSSDRLHALYVNHGLRPEEAKTETAWLQTFCQYLNVPFTAVSVSVKTFAAEEHRSLEDAARILRYRKLQEFCTACRCDSIAVAHNSDDQVETFFIHLLRGSGLQGLTGMRYRKGNIIRPLLDISKKELQKYLQKQHLEWKEDSSNSDLRFLRNRIRLNLLPSLEKDYTPSLRRQIIQLIDILHVDNHFLNSATKECWKRNVTMTKGKRLRLTLSCRHFIQEDPALQRRTIEQCCWQMGTRPDYEQIDAILKLMGRKTSGGELHLEKGLRVNRSGDELFFHYPLPKGQKRGSAESGAETGYRIEVTQPGRFEIPGTQNVINFRLKHRENIRDKHEYLDSLEPEALNLDADKLTFPLCLRTMRPGDRFTACGSGKTKKVARYFSEKSIPAFMRTSWPIITSAERIVAVAGMELDTFYKVTRETRIILVIEYREH